MFDCPLPRDVLGVTSNHVVYKQEQNGTNTGDQNAVQIQPSYANVTESLEQPSPDDCAHDAQQYIENNSFATMIHNVARGKSCNQTQQNPDE